MKKMKRTQPIIESDFTIGFASVQQRTRPNKVAKKGASRALVSSEVLLARTVPSSSVSFASVAVVYRVAENEIASTTERLRPLLQSYFEGALD